MADRFSRKICIVSPSENRYSETFIKNQIDNLGENVFPLHGKGRPFPTTDNSGRDFFKYTSLYGFYLRGMHRISPRFSIRTGERKTFANYLKRNSIEIVLAQYGPTGANLLRICKDLNLPLAVHFHGFDAYKTTVVDEYLERYKVMFASKTTLIAASQFMKNRLIELGANPENVFVNHYGVDCSLFSESDVRNSEQVFVGVGRFVDMKAPHLTLLAFSKILDEFPQAKLIIAGEGPLRDACIQMAKALGISASATFPGILPPHEVAKLHKSARAFIQHSMTAIDGSSESLGVVFIEAGASGLPSVTTSHDGIPEVVVDGETGFLVNEADINGMAERMAQLARDPELAARMGSAARKRVENIFQIPQSISGLASILEDTIAKHRQ